MESFDKPGDRARGAGRALPDPYSDELKEALRRRGHASAAHQHVYAMLYDRRDNPPTDTEIAEFVYKKLGKRFSQLQRRRRQVGEVFEIAQGPGHTYRLSGWRSSGRSDASIISRKLRFKVLQSGRCKVCGRSAEEDAVILHVDHILPQAWGGSDAEDNLQPLCADCNQGKKDYYGQFDQYTDKIKKAAAEDEPHRRIALLLKAFDGKGVPSELMGAVASSKQYQEDWQKRTRELRCIGIDFKTSRHKSPSGRMLTEYALTRWVDLPPGSLRAHIKRIEDSRK